MPLTSEGGADVSNASGAKSHGVRAEEGERISRRSAAKRGVSARTLSLDSGDEQGLCLATDGTSSFHRASNALLALARERRKGAQAEGSPGDRGPRGRAEMADDAAAAGCAGW